MGRTWRGVEAGAARSKEARADAAWPEEARVGGGVVAEDGECEGELSVDQGRVKEWRRNTREEEGPRIFIPQPLGTWRKGHRYLKKA
jgi:hypothetical protein